MLPALDVPDRPLDEIVPAAFRRARPARLPEVAEVDVVRHFTELSALNYGVDTGTYPLGSCTMKYNPRVNERAAALEGFRGLHPYQPESLAQGALELLYTLEGWLCEIAGLARATLQPAAGAHGELTGLLLMRACHEARGHAPRRILIPDTAHGTNPASVVMAGYEPVPVASDARGGVDMEQLRAIIAEGDIAGLMLTNPNTLGLFEENILEIAALVHEAGGLLYYDGANSNAVLGISRPGDMGFDIVHFNTHKTFSTPHGGGGPGAGPIVVGEELVPFLPVPLVERRDDGTYFLDDDRAQSIGKVRTFYGNVGVLVRAYAYIRASGPDGLRRVSERRGAQRELRPRRAPRPVRRALRPPLHARVRRLGHTTAATTACEPWTSPSGCSTTACTRRPPTSRSSSTRRSWSSRQRPSRTSHWTASSRPSAPWHARRPRTPRWCARRRSRCRCAASTRRRRRASRSCASASPRTREPRPREGRDEQERPSPRGSLDVEEEAPLSLVKVLPDASASGGAQMALDDGLLRTAEEIMARRYTWAPPALSLGKFQPVELKPGLPFDVVRRPSGGRAVLHGEGFEWSFAVAFPPGALGTGRRAGADVALPYELVAGAFAGSLRDLEVTLDDERTTPYQRSALCFAGVLRHDLMSRGEKLVAMAQARREGRVLVHGSVLERQPPDELTAAVETLLGQPWVGEGLEATGVVVDADRLWRGALLRLEAGLLMWKEASS